MMRNSLAVLIFVFGTSFVLQEDISLEHAIGYYQELKFEKSLEIFDELVNRAPQDISLIGRRGFVCYKYIVAVDTKLVEDISADRYSQVVKKGISDLKNSLAKYPGNEDNGVALKYLEGCL